MTKPIGAPGVFVALGVLVIVVDLWMNLTTTALTTVGVAMALIGGVLIVVRVAQT
jgi:hypothetical protein